MRAFASAALFLAACSVAPRETVRSGSMRQLSYDVRLPASSAVTILLVDDAPTVDAAALRAGVEGALESTFATAFRRALAYDAEGRDPAAHHAVDQRVVVVHPSATGDTRLVGPSDDPRLAWVASQAVANDAQLLGNATRLAIESFIAMPNAPYPLLDATGSVLLLVLGARPPIDDHERAIVASLGNSSEHSIRVLVATTRDADDRGPSIAASIGSRIVRIDALLPLAATPHAVGCEGEAPTSRLRAWAHDNGVDVGWTSWPCDATALAQRTLFPVELTTAVDVSTCPPWSGSEEMACELTFTDDEEGACDAVHGGCVLPELAGVDGEACRTTLACDGCSAGWCLTRVPELAPRDGCGAPPLRWIGGALPIRAGELRVVCDEP